MDRKSSLLARPDLWSGAENASSWDRADARPDAGGLPVIFLVLVLESINIIWISLQQPLKAHTQRHHFL